MKKLTILFLTISLAFSCQEKHSTTYASLSGKIENNKDSIIVISGQKGILKKIAINEDGSFKDTLKVNNAAIYTFQINNTKRAPIYLKNGFDLSLSGDSNADNFMESFTYDGIGAENSKFILSQLAFSRSIGNPTAILELEGEAFNTKIDALKVSYDSIVASYSNLDSTLLSMARQQNTQMQSYFKQTYANNKNMKKGNPSPKFENYTDFKGGKKSLDSFKGKYVYIDVWATWCGPCIQQIPFLQNLEKEYHNKNIEFVSISTDEARRSGGSWEVAEEKWRDFVKQREMSGVQLWSGQDYAFQQAYQITGIPRFILIDPEGNIVNANASRPSDPNLKKLLNSLDL